jgi:hypothetical protein
MPAGCGQTSWYAALSAATFPVGFSAAASLQHAVRWYKQRAGLHLDCIAGHSCTSAADEAKAAAAAVAAGT